MLQFYDFFGGYVPLTIRQLSLLAPSIPWLLYINRILSTSIFQVHDSETIYVRLPYFVEKLGALLDSTPVHIQANYFLWRVVSQSLIHLNEEAFQIVRKYNWRNMKKFTRSERCLYEVTDRMKVATGSSYARNIFDPTSRDIALSMFYEMKTAMDSMMKEEDWMDEKTKERARLKANTMQSMIAYPLEFLRIDKIEIWYEDLELSESEYFRNILKLEKFNLDQLYKGYKDSHHRGWFKDY